MRFRASSMILEKRTFIETFSMVRNVDDSPTNLLHLCNKIYRVWDLVFLELSSQIVRQMYERQQLRFMARHGFAAKWQEI